MGRGLWDDSNAGHVLMWRLGAKSPGELLCMQWAPAPRSHPSPHSSLLPSFSKYPLRAAADKQSGKERAKRHNANQQSKGISRETLLGILQSASTRAELLPTPRISPQPFFQLQALPRLPLLPRGPPKLPTRRTCPRHPPVPTPLQQPASEEPRTGTKT